MQKPKTKNQNYRLKFKVFTFLIVILYFPFYILHSPKVIAQTFSLGISPPLLEVMIMPGKSITQVYQLENSGEETKINTQIVPFKPSDEQGNIKIQITSHQSPITSHQSPITNNWFSFENADISLGKPFVLKSGESKQIILRIKIPENAREDDYYFTLLFQSQPTEKMGNSAALGMGMIGSNILLTVSRTGKPVKKGEIAEFKLKNCKSASFLCLLDSFVKPEFLLRVKNTGRTFWKPFGKIKIEGVLGQRWEQEILPENVLANSIRQINFATSSAQPSFLIGPYRAKAEFNLEEDGQGQTLSANTSFLALPGKLGLAIFISLALIWLIKKKINLT